MQLADPAEQPLILDRSRGAATAAPLVVRGHRHAQRRADRLDPEAAAILVDITAHLGRSGSSSLAKNTLADHRVLGAVGSVGDAYDNALAESFVDSFKTELISDRVWRSRSQLELAVVEYVGWYNAARLHESLGDVPPAEYEQQHALREATTLAGAGV